MKKQCLFIYLIASFSVLLAQQDTGLVVVKPAVQNLKPFMRIVSDMEIGFPTGDFNDEIDRKALVGKGIGFYFPIKGMQLDVGFRLGDLTYDKLNFSYFDTIDGRTEKLVRKTKNKVWLWQCNAHFEPPVRSALRPYLEAGVGLQRLFTKSFSREPGFNLFMGEGEALLNSRFDKKTHHSDWGGTISGAAGIKVNLGRNHDHSYWGIQVGYRYGSSSDFFIKKDLPEVLREPLDNLELRRSKFSMVFVKIGFVLFFV